MTDMPNEQSLREALRVSEERYRAVIEHVSDGMLVVLDERIVFSNPQAARLVGMAPAEMLGASFVSRVHPDDLALVLDRHRRGQAGEAVPHELEFRVLLPDGSVRWLDVRVSAIPWNGRHAVLTFFSDVTGRKQLEERLRVTLEERETVLRNAVVGIALLDADGRFRWANPAMERIFGHPPDGLRKLEPLYLSREQYLQVGADVARSIQQGQSYESELQMRRLDGTVFWAALSGCSVNPRDTSRGTVWTVMDITRRKELEVALQRSSSEREGIFNSALVGVCFNVNRRIQYVNDKYLEMTGYARHELEGQSSRVFYADDEAFESDGRLTNEALARDGDFVSERQLLRRDGAPFWARLAGRCLVAKDPQSGVIWTVLDISERKRAEDDIRDALARQTELNALRTRFVSMTSHEFRTPLATIQSSAELLEHYGERLPETERKELLQSIGAGVGRMAGMLDRILLIGQSEAQMLDFKPRATHLVRLCQELAEQARALLPASGLRLETDFTDAPAQGQYDEALLRHILSNLLSNAVRYSPGGGTIGFSVRRDAGATLFEVRDQGIGIPADEIAHLFESFHRASNVGDIKGTGLGLAIVKKAVERHGGEIGVSSELGRGTCFKVRL
jgi:PAS domain S-box-containing protein